MAKKKRRRRKQNSFSMDQNFELKTALSREFPEGEIFS